MELIIINKNKIKIMLSDEDMKKYGIFCGDSLQSFPKARVALKSILSDVHAETDFNADSENERLFIQLYPSAEGGCEMFVSKTDLLYNEDSQEDASLMHSFKDQGVAQAKPIKRPSTPKRATLTYCFERFEWMLTACRELYRRNFSGESSLFRDKEGRYYLLLCPAASEGQKCAPSSFLSEFGELESTEHARFYINENGSCICQENAVELMSKF